MSREEDQKKVQYLYDVKKLSFCQIAAETGIPRNRCSKLYCGSPASRVLRGSVLDDYRELISGWVKEFPSLKAKQIYERLKERGVAISYQSVTLYTRELRRKRQRIFWPLTFLPGEEGQVDWFFINHAQLGKLSGFALILSYSRLLYAHIFPRHSFEFFIEGHLKAFQSFAGYPRALRYDNLKSVVLKREPLTYNPAFLDFAHHYAFDIRLCNVAAGNEKGRVERAIRSMRDGFLNTAEQFHSLETLNYALHAWLEKRNQDMHRVTLRAPVEAIKDEKLKPLPAIDWTSRIILPPTMPSKTGLVSFDTNSYSVPEHLLGKKVFIHAFTDKIEIYNSNAERVATHIRSFARSKIYINPKHRSFTNSSYLTKKLRILTVIKNLDQVLERFLVQNQIIGEEPINTAYALFKLLKQHSRHTIISAAREALANHSPKLISISTMLEPLTLPEDVSPQNKELLNIQYTPRPLTDYEFSK